MKKINISSKQTIKSNVIPVGKNSIKLERVSSTGQTCFVGPGFVLFEIFIKFTFFWIKCFFSAWGLFVFLTLHSSEDGRITYLVTLFYPFNSSMFQGQAPSGTDLKWGFVKHGWVWLASRKIILPCLYSSQHLRANKWAMIGLSSNIE